MAHFRSAMGFSRAVASSRCIRATSLSPPASKRAGRVVPGAGRGRAPGPENNEGTSNDVPWPRSARAAIVFRLRRASVSGWLELDSRAATDNGLPSAPPAATTGIPAAAPARNLRRFVRFAMRKLHQSSCGRAADRTVGRCTHSRHGPLDPQLGPSGHTLMRLIENTNIGIADAINWGWPIEMANVVIGAALKMRRNQHLSSARDRLGAAGIGTLQLAFNRISPGPA
jgi:hypothetical protein